jgi:hypothetical protein
MNVRAEDRAVADRVNVDIEGLREEIANAHADNPLWPKLSLSQQLRQLVEEGIATAKAKGKK